MPDDDLSSEQEAELEQLTLETVREATRVGVDWKAAAERLRALAAQEWVLSEDGTTGETTLGLDLTVLLSTLRRLPDGAGTDRFLAEYEAADPGDAPPAA